MPLQYILYKDVNSLKRAKFRIFEVLEEFGKDLEALRSDKNLILGESVGEKKPSLTAHTNK